MNTVLDRFSKFKIPSISILWSSSSSITTFSTGTFKIKLEKSEKLISANVIEFIFVILPQNRKNQFREMNHLVVDSENIFREMNHLVVNRENKLGEIKKNWVCITYPTHIPVFKRSTWKFLINLGNGARKHDTNCNILLFEHFHVLETALRKNYAKIYWISVTSITHNEGSTGI